MKKNIGFLSYSLPFKWWDATNIAHNRIFSYLINGMCKDYNLFVIGNKLDIRLKMILKNKGVVVIDPMLSSCKNELQKLNALILFCGPYFPLSPGSMPLTALHILKDFKGRAVYLTCDYMLQFDFSIQRYGSVLQGWPEDAFTKGKTWRYVLHGGFDHHFKTEKQAAKITWSVARRNFIEVPLNKSGIHPKLTDLVPQPPVYPLLYCGSYREGREEFFKQYFMHPLAANWYISTTQEKKFRAMRGLKAKLMGPFAGDIWRMISKSTHQIIASDKIDNRNAHTPLPTRFWEACSAGSMVAFDKSCELWVSNKLANPIYVDGPEDLANLIKGVGNRKYRRVIEEQYELIKGFNPMEEWKVNSWFDDK